MGLKAQTFQEGKGAVHNLEFARRDPDGVDDKGLDILSRKSDGFYFHIAPIGGSMDETLYSADMIMAALELPEGLATWLQSVAISLGTVNRQVTLRMLEIVVALGQAVKMKRLDAAAVRLPAGHAKLCGGKLAEAARRLSDGGEGKSSMELKEAAEISGVFYNLYGKHFEPATPGDTAEGAAARARGYLATQGGRDAERVLRRLFVKGSPGNAKGGAAVLNGVFAGAAELSQTRAVLDLLASWREDGAVRPRMMLPGEVTRLHKLAYVRQLIQRDYHGELAAIAEMRATERDLEKAVAEAVQMEAELAEKEKERAAREVEAAARRAEVAARQLRLEEAAALEVTRAAHARAAAAAQKAFMQQRTAEAQARREAAVRRLRALEDSPANAKSPGERGWVGAGGGRVGLDGPPMMGGAVGRGLPDRRWEATGSLPDRRREAADGPPTMGGAVGAPLTMRGAARGRPAERSVTARSLPDRRWEATGSLPEMRGAADGPPRARGGTERASCPGGTAGEGEGARCAPARGGGGPGATEEGGLVVSELRPTPPPTRPAAISVTDGEDDVTEVRGLRGPPPMMPDLGSSEPPPPYKIPRKAASVGAAGGAGGSAGLGHDGAAAGGGGGDEVTYLRVGGPPAAPHFGAPLGRAPAFLARPPAGRSLLYGGSGAAPAPPPSRRGGAAAAAAEPTAR